MSRISELPRRDWREDAEAYIEALTQLLKTQTGAQRLRAGQTAGLLEFAILRGLVMQGRVGIGKTLLLALAPVMLGRKRPLIMTTGGLKDETYAHIQTAREHWQIPDDLQILSYTALSNMPRKGLDLTSLWPEGPDYIGCDEVHNLSNVRTAACSRQINEWNALHPDSVTLNCSGSLDLEGLPSFGHIFDWALRSASPLPRTPHEIRAWSEVIDDGEMMNAPALCAELEIPRGSSIEEIREAFRQRIISAPGVIVDDTPYKGVPLTVKEHLYDPGLDEHFQKLRELGQRPDGVDVLPDDAGDVDADAGAEPDRCAGGRIAETARQLASGFFYKMWPPAPEDWLKARRRYFSYVRGCIEDGVFLTEAQVRADAIARSLPVWVEWAAIQPTFTPQFHTVWLTDRIADRVREWAKEGPGIVWTEHIALGIRLQQLTGCTYFGGKGLSSDGRKITDGPRPSKDVVIASRRANGTGRNLQHQWQRSLLIQSIGRPYIWEQTIGRIHREGLEEWADWAHVDILMRCSEDWRARKKVLAGSQKTCQSFYSQKACSVPWQQVSKPSSGWAFA